MIRLTRFDGSSFVLNAEIIQYVEAAPDTIITLVTRDKLMVKETVDEVISKVIEFKRKIFRGDLEFRRDPEGETIE
ncbi:MAG TPA: flagellar FlbD family protein [Acidobacteriota bacterium]|nr:flagellar FlbD family protein [Acidobacteriota bacterium]